MSKKRSNPPPPDFRPAPPPSPPPLYRSKSHLINEKKWQHVFAALTEMQKQSARHAIAFDGLQVSPESPLVAPMGELIDLNLQTLSLLIGDTYQSLSWYVYECDYGRSPQEAGCPNDMRRINTHERLRWLIELDCRDKLSAEDKI